jgi:hypothetical protein
VVVVVVVVVVDFFNPPFTGEVLVVSVLLVVTLGGLANVIVAKEGATTSISAPAIRPITTKVVLVWIMYHKAERCTIKRFWDKSRCITLEA